MSRVFFLYLLGINGLSFFLCIQDKSYARRKGRRIAEKTFFLLSFFGGSVGMLVGMYLFRHKTKHKSFTIGIPLLLLLEMGVLLFLKLKTTLI